LFYFGDSPLFPFLFLFRKLYIVFVLFYSGFIVCIEGVPRGLPGGCLGVARGLGGVNLSEPPGNPLSALNKERKNRYESYKKISRSLNACKNYMEYVKDFLLPEGFI